MPQQIDDQQFYAIKACLERAYQEIQDAWSIMYGKGAVPTTQGAATTIPNPGGKQFTPPTPPTVTKDHQASLDEKNPEVQAQRSAEEQVSQAALKGSISNDVLVISASANGLGDYFALVQCEQTMQQASIRIEEDEYEELQSTNANDNVRITLEQSQIDDAEWEPMRGTSTDPQGQCNCAGNVSNANPYNDPKVDAEMAAGHTRKCRFWDYNTITFDQQTGRACQVELDKVDASATYGFDMYNNARKVIIARAADPNDPITIIEGNEDVDEFGVAGMVQAINQMASRVTGNPNATVVFGDDDEDDV
jgi:hypothetical protein